MFLLAYRLSATVGLSSSVFAEVMLLDKPGTDGTMHDMFV